MRILITGIGGFLGQRLAARLAGGGHEVFGIVRRPVAQPHPRVTLIHQDLSHLDVTALPEGIEALYTLAQSSRFREFPAQAEEVFAVNVTANLRLYQWAQDRGVRRVVHASSGGIYGGRQGARFVESDLLAVDSPLGFYLGTKLCSEVVLQNYRHFFDTTVVMRPFFIYGPGQRSDMLIARLIESVRAGRPISLQGADGLRMNPVYVDDAAAAFEAALGLDGAHVLNCAGPDVLSLREIAMQIGEAVGREPVFEFREGEPEDYVADMALAASLVGSPQMHFRDGVRHAAG